MNRMRTVLLLADRRQSQTSKALKTGYDLLTAFTPDHAVALCVNKDVDAVVLDEEHFVVTEGWSVAQSLKMIKARICIVLVVHGKITGKELPVGIDAIVPDGDTQALLRTLSRLL